MIVVIVQSVSRVQLFVTPWTAAGQAPLSFTISQSLLRLMSIESDGANQTSHPLPSLSPPALNLSQHQIFSNESALCIRRPQYWSFSISPSNEYSGLISFRIDWFDLLAVQEALKSLRQFKSITIRTKIQKHQFFGAQPSL